MLSAKAEDIMRNCKYVDPLSVQNNWLGRNRSVSIDYSSDLAAAAGVNRSDVGNALQAATDGYAIGVINDRDKTIPIYMQIRNTDGSKISDLSTLPVWTMMNINISGNDLASMMNGTTTASELSNKMYNTTLLSSCVKSISPSWSEGTIHRLNGQRVIEAECDPDITNHNATPAKVVENIAEEIKAIPLPEGYGMRFAGEGETSDESMDIIMSFLPIMVAIIVIILLLLFNSWKKLAVILLCFPFVICGIIPALLITDTPFTFLAILGLMGLMGMTIKNAIVLVDEIARLTDVERIELYPGYCSRYCITCDACYPRIVYNYRRYDTSCRRPDVRFSCCNNYRRLADRHFCHFALAAYFILCFLQSKTLMKKYRTFHIILIPDCLCFSPRPYACRLS